MATRNCISWLQEFLAGKHLPLPVYIEEGFGTSFTCTCLAHGIRTVGHGTNKKSAKQDAATKALAILTDGAKHFSVALEKTTTTLMINHQEQHFKNYVGELNEHSTKYGMNYPKYSFLTSCYNTDGQFVFQCEFLGHKCKGTASNKKDAKQESAKAMLKLIEGLEGPTLLDQYKKAAIVRKEVHVGNSETIINLFNSLSITPKNVCQRVEESIMVADPSIQIPKTLELIMEELRIQDIRYQMKDLPAKAGYFVVSVILDNSEFTLYGAGKTKNEAVIDALQSVLLIKKTGCLISKKSLFS